VKIRICFVCLGNICRSPTAEGIMLSLIEEAGLEEHVIVESAGTGAEHIGEEADPRSQECAVARGINLESVSQEFIEDDFERFEYVLAMDRENQDDLISLAPDDDAQEKIFLLRAFDPASRSNREVPDPYYGGDNGFDEVFDVIDAACRGLLEHLIEHHELPD
jgi:protein-tyrosine phosphatase